MLKNSTQPAGGGNVMYPGKVPGKVKYTFAFGALGKVIPISEKNYTAVKTKLSHIT